jgi:cell division transport system ATP-binding protein
MFNGVDSVQLSPNKKLQLRRLIGVIPQTPKFLRDQTVFDNLALPLKVAQHTQQEITKRVYDMLEQIGMTLYAQAYPQMLSSGEQECINIARALITRPILVLADEPTSHVDHSAKQKMLDLLMTANKFGVSMLVATHDLALVARSKGRALFLKKGCLANEERAA